MKTIELTKYDYYNNEKGCYIVYIDEGYKTVEFDVKIKDETTVWDCYLLDCKHIAKSQTYKCRYKVYGK